MWWWLVISLGLWVAACDTTEPRVEQETQTPTETEGDFLEDVPSRELGDFWSSVLDFRAARTWGNPDRPANAQTLGEKLGQGSGANLWGWTQCARLYVKTGLGGPEGTGEVVRTDDAAARYRLWSLDPLTVEVEIGGWEGQPADELQFFDERGKSVAKSDQDRLAVKVEGVETLYCDARWHLGDGTGWLPCRELSLLTADRTAVTTRDDQTGMVRILEDGVIQWAIRGNDGRVGMATGLLGVECEGQDLPGVETLGGKGSKRSCSRDSYDLRRTAWKRLRPARVAGTSEDCVGYCFDGFTDSVTKQDPSVVRVMVVEADGRLTRATVSGTRVWYRRDEKGARATPSRFACFDRTTGKGLVPHFEDCVQMTSTPGDDWACLTGAKHQHEMGDVRETQAL